MRRRNLRVFFIWLLIVSHSLVASAGQNFGPRVQVINTKKDTIKDVGYQWILKKDVEDIHVYTRKVKGSAILEYKADVIVDAPMDKVLALFEDDEKVPLWFYEGARANVVGQANDIRRVYYFIAKLPWPISARDVVFERTKLEDSKTGGVRYTLTSLPDRLPRKKGVVRVIHLNASWRFIPLIDGRTKIYFQQHSHPEGFIPPCIANQLVIDVPFYSLRNFRKLIEERRLPQEI